MGKYIVLFLFIVAIAGCGVQGRINKLEGHSVSFLLEELGQPNTIVPRTSDSLYIYEIKKDLRSTEINKAALTLDPMITPKVEKTDKYMFTIKNGIVLDSKHEIEYERKDKK